MLCKKKMLVQSEEKKKCLLCKNNICFPNRLYCCLTCENIYYIINKNITFKIKWHTKSIIIANRN